MWVFISDVIHTLATLDVQTANQKMIISQTYSNNFVVQTATMNQKMIISQTYNDNFSCPDSHIQPKDNNFTNIQWQL